MGCERRPGSDGCEPWRLPQWLQIDGQRAGIVVSRLHLVGYASLGGEEWGIDDDTMGRSRWCGRVGYGPSVCVGKSGAWGWWWACYERNLGPIVGRQLGMTLVLCSKPRRCVFAV